MLTLLLVVLICGVVAWVIQSLAIVQPFKTIALAILLIICLVVFFDVVLGVHFPMSMR